jgi:methylmalonyl-CoA/ethylmalonyl-CoA epimerase
MVLRIDHVSIAVKDYKNADDFFKKLLGVIPGGAGRDECAGFKFQVYSAGDLSRLEIIAPDRGGSFLDNYLENREGGVHHITFQVDDINSARSYLEKQNIPYFGYSEKYENWKELFIHPSVAYGVLIQFAEFNPHEWIAPSVSIKNGCDWELRKNGNRVIFSMLHPGGGKMERDFSNEQLDRLIEDLVEVRKELSK